MTLFLRMRNEMSQMQVSKMAAVVNLQEVVGNDIDLDTTDPPLAATKTGDEMHLDNRETPTGSSQADVVENNSVSSSIRDDDVPSLPGEACAPAVSGDRTCVISASQCNHVGGSNSVTKLLSSASPVIVSSETVCAVTNSIVDAGRTDSCASRTSTNVNNAHSDAVSDQAAAAVVSDTFEPSNVDDQSVSVVEGTAALAAVKDVMSAQSTAPGSPHGVTVPSIRTNAVNMVMPAAVTPSAALRTLAPRIIVSTSPATTVLRVQTAGGNVTTQPLPTVPSQQLILPVRNQGTAVPRVLFSFISLFSFVNCQIILIQLTASSCMLSY